VFIRPLSRYWISRAGESDNLTMFREAAATCAYSDFAHLDDKGMISFVLSMGNDGMDDMKLRANLAAARAKNAAPKLKPKAEKDGEDGVERGEDKPQKKCDRKACKEFQEKLEKREEKVMTERQNLTELIVKRTEELKNTEERMAEVERINSIAEERSKGIKSEIQQQKEEMERMEQQQVVVKQENIEMGHKIMILELELQKQHFEARQAQAEMIKALWYKKGAETKARTGDLPALRPVTPLITTSSFKGFRARTAPGSRVRKPHVRAITKYSGLVRQDLKDVIELETVFSTPNPAEFFPFSSTQSRPGTVDGRLRGGSRRGLLGPGLERASVRSAPTRIGERPSTAF